MFLNSPRTKFFITGPPGIGKTTLIKHLLNFLNTLNLPFCFYGFITEEVKEKGKRQGFKIQSINSKESYILARRKNSIKFSELKNKPSIGKYVVFLNHLETLINKLYKNLENSENFFIIDEIGKMEILSPKFCKFIEALLNSPNYLIATIGLGNNPFFQKIKNYEPSFWCKITKTNRDFLKERLKLEFSRKGKLIVIEGIDGAGKTTFAKALFEKLKAKGINCLLSAEPTSGPYGIKLKELLNQKKVLPLELNEFFLKDRKWHVENVLLPGLNEGKWIILDRYYLSTIAYQGAQDLPLKDLLIENETIAPLPDLIIFLDLPIDVAFERINKRNKKLSIFEKKEFLEKVSVYYKYYLPWFNHIILDAKLSIEENLKNLLELNSKFKSTFT